MAAHEPCTLCKVSAPILRADLEPGLPYRLCESCMQVYAGLGGEEAERFREGLWEMAALDIGEKPGAGRSRFKLEALQRLQAIMLKAGERLNRLPHLAVDADCFQELLMGIAPAPVCTSCDRSTEEIAYISGYLFPMRPTRFVLCKACCMALLTDTPDRWMQFHHELCRKVMAVIPTDYAAA